LLLLRNQCSEPPSSFLTMFWGSTQQPRVVTELKRRVSDKYKATVDVPMRTVDPTRPRYGTDLIATGLWCSSSVAALPRCVSGAISG
jgi:hypothetical protein